MFNGSFLSSSSRVFFPLLSRVPARGALLVAVTLTRDGGGCSGGHVIYLSPYYPPCPRVRGSLYLFHLLQPPSSRGAILGTPTISFSSSLFPLLSFFSIARGKPGSPSPSCRCFSLFLLFFISFLSASILLSRALSAHFSLPFYLLSFFTPSPPSFRPRA